MSLILHCSDFTQDGGVARQIELLCTFACERSVPSAVLLDDNPAGRRLKSRLAALNCCVLLRPLYRGRVDPAIIRFVVGQVLRTLQPSVVHFHCGSQRSGIDIREEVVKFGTPLVITEYFVSRSVVIDAPLRQRIRRNYAKAFASITSCRQQRRLLRNTYRFRCSREIELGFCSPPAQHFGRIARAHTTFNLICVARFVAQKGHEVLLAALKNCDEIAGRTPQLWLVGGGPLAGELRQKVADLGLKTQVRFSGWRGNLSAIMAGAHGMVLASHDEGQPIVLLEATAIGLPWIATDVGGVKELSQFLGCGLIIPAGSPRALIRALQLLGRSYDTEVRRTMAAKRRLALRHSPKASFSKILALWHVAIACAKAKR